MFIFIIINATTGQRYSLSPRVIRHDACKYGRVQNSANKAAAAGESACATARLTGKTTGCKCAQICKNRYSIFMSILSILNSFAHGLTVESDSETTVQRIYSSLAFMTVSRTANNNNGRLHSHVTTHMVRTERISVCQQHNSHLKNSTEINRVIWQVLLRLDYRTTKNKVKVSETNSLHQKAEIHDIESHPESRPRICN